MTRASFLIAELSALQVAGKFAMFFSAALLPPERRPPLSFI